MADDLLNAMSLTPINPVLWPSDFGEMNKESQGAGDFRPFPMMVLFRRRWAKGPGYLDNIADVDSERQNCSYSKVDTEKEKGHRSSFIVVK